MQSHILLYGNPRQFPNYERALVQAGAVVRFGSPKGCDGLLLPGGGDIYPEFYGATIENCNNVDPKRDKDELALCRYFINQKLPILGICRGLQVLNVAFGGTLQQHIENHCQVNGQDRIHRTHCTTGQWLESLYGRCFSVNSAHHQSIQQLGSGLKAIQWSEDGVIEAISHQTLPVYGVQWHPERLWEGGKKHDTVDGNQLFSWFLTLCN